MKINELKQILSNHGHETVLSLLDSMIQKETRDMAYDERVGFEYMVADLITESMNKYDGDDITPLYDINDILFSNVFTFCDALGWWLTTKCELKILVEDANETA